MTRKDWSDSLLIAVSVGTLLAVVCLIAQAVIRNVQGAPIAGG